MVDEPIADLHSIEILLVEDDPGDVLRSYRLHANAYVVNPPHEEPVRQ